MKSLNDMENPMVYTLVFFTIMFIGAAFENGHYFLIPYLQGRGVQVGALGGVAMGIFYGASFVLRPFVPIIAQTWGERNTLRFGYFCLLVSTVATVVFSRSISMVILFRAVAGVGLGLIGVAITSYQNFYIPAETRGRTMALITIAYSLPALCVVPLMEILIVKKLFLTYILFFPLLTFSGLYVMLKLPDIREAVARSIQAEKDENPQRQSYLALLKKPEIILFVLAATLFAFTDAAQLTLVLLAEEAGVMASYFFSASAGTILMFRIFLRRLIDILPRKIFTPLSTIFTSALILVLTAANTPKEFFICGVLFGFAMGFGYPSFMCLMFDLAGQLYITRMAVLFGLLYSGTFFITPIAMNGLIGLTGSAVSSYRLFYSIVLIGAVCVLFMSLRVNRVKLKV
jgi:MFS family permease